MKLSKYKLLTFLLLTRKWNTNHGSTPLTNDIPSLISDRHFLSNFLGANYLQTLTRLKAQGLISSAEGKPDGFLPSTRRVGESAGSGFSSAGSLVITYRGVNDLLLRFPLLDYLDKDWDEKLTLVIFNINEKNRKGRDRLRYNLKALGFGCLNRSLYLSPHLSVKEIGHLLAAFADSSTRRVDGKNPSGFPSAAKTLAFSVPIESFQRMEKMSDFWEIGKVADLYEKALTVSIGLDPLRGSNPGTSDPGTSGRFISKFVDALLLDPLLPLPLLTKSWVGAQALEIARNIVCK